MIYLNNSAGTKAYPEVVNIITDVLENHWGNPHDANSFAHDAQMIINNVTEQVANDINCDSDEIVWTSGACEANSLAILGVLNANPNMKFYTTHLEHASINKILESLPEHMSGVITNDNYGFVNLYNLESIMHWNYMHGVDTLISVSFANSEIGTIQWIKQIAKTVHKYGGILHVDATQAYPWFNIDVQDLGIDLMSVSGQKLHCVRGIGFLYVKNGIELKPLIYGSQQNSRRAGTMPTHLIAAFGEALDVTRNDYITDYVGNLTEKLKSLIENIDGVTLNGPIGDRLPNNLSFTIDGVNAESLVAQCDVLGLIIGKGSACQSYEAVPSQTLMSIGLTEEQALSTIRITLDEFNTNEEIEQAAKILTHLINELRKNN